MELQDYTVLFSSYIAYTTRITSLTKHTTFDFLLVVIRPGTLTVLLTGERNLEGRHYGYRHHDQLPDATPELWGADVLRAHILGNELHRRY